MLTERWRQRALFAVCLVLVIAIRASCSSRGWNFDTEMLYRITSLPRGANFYREITLWANWGPIPYNIFQLFRALPGGDQLSGFHSYLAAFFTTLDVVSSVVLWRNWGLRAAAWFLLFSPISIVVSGFHCNADPAVVAFVLVGYYLHTRFGRDDSSIHPAFLVCLGVSLAFKHAFVLFPLWLALRPASLRERARILIVPYGVWMLFALYYLVPTTRYFKHNVLSYGGWSGNALIPFAIEWVARQLHIAGPGLSKAWLPLFLLGMAAVGWRIRRWPWSGRFCSIRSRCWSSRARSFSKLNLASFSIAAALDGPGIVFSAFAAYFYFGDPAELHLWTLPPWLQNSGFQHRGRRTSLVDLPGDLAVLLVRRLSRWSLDDEAGEWPQSEEAIRK